MSIAKCSRNRCVFALFIRSVYLCLIDQRNVFAFLAYFSSAPASDSRTFYWKRLDKTNKHQKPLIPVLNLRYFCSQNERSLDYFCIVVQLYDALYSLAQLCTFVEILVSKISWKKKSEWNEVGKHGSEPVVRDLRLVRGCAFCVSTGLVNQF